MTVVGLLFVCFLKDQRLLRMVCESPGQDSQLFLLMYSSVLVNGGPLVRPYKIDLLASLLIEMPLS